MANMFRDGLTLKLMIWEGYSKIWQLEKLGDGVGVGGGGWGWVGGWFLLILRIGRANQ